MDNNNKLISIVLALIATTVLAQDIIPIKIEEPITEITSEKVVELKDRIAITKVSAGTRKIANRDVTVSQTKWSWRFCHDGTKLIIPPFFSNGETWTRYRVEECTTLAEAVDLIKELGLKVSKAQNTVITNTVSVPISVVRVLNEE